MSKEQPQQPPIQIPEIYSNVANIHFNQYEFAVNLRVSPQFAKELAKILTENVAQYEQMVGELPEGDMWQLTRMRRRRVLSLCSEPRMQRISSRRWKMEILRWI
jgi:hypothetical protein